MAWSASLLFVFLLSFFPSGKTFGSPASAAEPHPFFLEGMRYYREGRFNLARLAFEKVLGFPEGQDSPKAYLMVGRCLYMLGNYRLAIKSFEGFLSRYPRDRYAPIAKYWLGHSSYRIEKYRDAASRYAELLSMKGLDPGLSKRGALALGYLYARELITSEDVEHLRAMAPSDAMEEAIGWGEARSLVSSRRKREAKYRLEQLRNAYPDGNLKAEILELIDQIPVGDNIRLGVILPLSGENASLGLALKEGIDLAMYDLGEDLGELDIVFEDTESDLVSTVKSVQRLADMGVVAIMGPVLSSHTIAAAGVADCLGIPLIAPTANSNGIASIGSNIFQMNTPIGIQGRKIGEYAVNKLELGTLAVLAPIDPYGEEMAEGFKSEIERLGGVIVDQEWYSLGTTDFGKQLGRIREIGLKIMFADSLGVPVDSLETLYVEDQVPAWQDTSWAEAPVTSIDGVLVAAWSEDVVQAVPQLHFHRIKCFILGGSGWNNTDVIPLGGQYVEGAIFVSPYFEDDYGTRKFIDDFRLKFVHTPNEISAFGYDAMTLLAKTCLKGARTRGDVRSAISKVRNYHGASGEISFSPGRFNTSVHFLKIENGRIIPLSLE